jgi:hypothetical protein
MDEPVNREAGYGTLKVPFMNMKTTWLLTVLCGASLTAQLAAASHG